MNVKDKQKLKHVCELGPFDGRRMRIGFEIFNKAAIPAVILIASLMAFRVQVNLFWEICIVLLSSIIAVTVAADVAGKEFRLKVHGTFWWSFLWRLWIANLVIKVLYELVALLFISVFYPVGLQGALIVIVLYFATGVVAMAWAAPEAYWVSASRISDESLDGFGEDDDDTEDYSFRSGNHRDYQDPTNTASKYDS